MHLKLQLSDFNMHVFPNWRDSDVKLDMEAKPPCKTCTHVVKNCILMAPFVTNSTCSSIVSYTFLNNCLIVRLLKLAL